MKYSLPIFFLALGFSALAETNALPDLRGTYGLDTNNDVQLFIVNSSNEFQLIDESDNYIQIKIGRVYDRIDVAGIVTYFIAVTTNGKSDTLELVHNQNADYFMMELESNPSLRWKSMSNAISMVGN